MKGSCLCKSVIYEIRGAIQGINYCHCSQCRKASGSAFGTSAAVNKHALRILTGLDNLAWYESTPGKKRYFCRVCGSPLYSEREGAAQVYIRLGTLDDDPKVRPEVHIHVSSKANWYRITDNLLQLNAEEGLWF